MRIVFADASYWIALINPRDRRHADAVAIGAQFGPAHKIVTSQMVMVETLNSLARLGGHLRSHGVQMVGEIGASPTVPLL